jgi:hypothetical protein
MSISQGDRNEAQRKERKKRGRGFYLIMTRKGLGKVRIPD